MFGNFLIKMGQRSVKVKFPDYGNISLKIMFSCGLESKLGVRPRLLKAYFKCAQAQGATTP